MIFIKDQKKNVKHFIRAITVERYFLQRFISELQCFEVS